MGLFFGRPRGNVAADRNGRPFTQLCMKYDWLQNYVAAAAMEIGYLCK